MRHLYGAALGVIMIVAVFFGGAWGYLHLLKAPPRQGTALAAGGGSLLSNSTAVLALAALAATAMLVGALLTVPRISPLAAGLPGLLLIAWTALYLASPWRAVGFIPLRSHSFGAGSQALLSSGMLGAAGVVMIFPLFIASRWRGPRRADAAAPAEPEPEPVSDVHDELPRRREEQSPLVGTVVGRPADIGAWPVDTSRVTGASRALRNTSSFRISTSGQSRATGAFRPAPDSDLPRRQYPAADD